MAIHDFLLAKPSIDSTVYIAPSADVIGDVLIGANSSVWHQTVIRGDVNAIRIGKGTNIQDGSVLHVTHANPEEDIPGCALVIGDHVTVGHRVVLHGCTVEDYCLIGMGSVVSDQVHIEPYVLLGAGSLVPPGKRLLSGHLYHGSPARKVRELTNHEKHRLRYSAEHYVRLKNDYME